MKKLSLIALLAGLTISAGAVASVAPTPAYENQPIVAMAAATLAEEQASTMEMFKSFNQSAIFVLSNSLSSGAQANVNMKVAEMEAAINATLDEAELWTTTKALASEYLSYIFGQAGITDFFNQTDYASSLSALSSNDLVGLETLLIDTLRDTVEAANAGYEAVLNTKKTEALQALFTTVGCDIADAQTRVDAAIGLDGLATVMKALSKEGAEWSEMMIVRITNASTLEEVTAMYNLAIAEINDASNEADAALATAKTQAIATLEATYGASYVTDTMKTAINGAADLNAVEIAKLTAEKEIKATIAQEVADAEAAALETAKTNAKDALSAYTDYYTTEMGDRIDAATSIEQVEIIRSALETDIKSTIEIKALTEELNTLIENTNGKIDAMQTSINNKIEALQTELNTLIATTQQKIVEVQNSVNGNIDALETELNKLIKDTNDKIAAMETAIKNNLTDLETELNDLMDETNQNIENVQNSVNGNIDGLETVLNKEVAALQKAIDALKAQITASEKTMTDALKAELTTKVDSLETQLAGVQDALTNEIHERERPIEIKQWIAICGSIGIIAAQAIIIIVILVKRRNMMAVEMARLEKEIERKKKEKKGVECNRCGVRLSVKPDSKNTYICPVCSNKFRVQKKKKK